jgi:hypothetical protein
MKSAGLGEAEREGVDAGKGLEDDALGLGDRDGGFRWAAGPAEDIGAVGEQSDRIAAAGEVVGGEGVLADLQAGLGDAGRVDEGEDGTVPDRHLRVHANESLVTATIVKPFVARVVLIITAGVHTVPLFRKRRS